MNDDIIAIIGQKSKEMWINHPEYKEELSKRNKKNPLIHTSESKNKISKARKEKIKNGSIDLSKSLDILWHDPNVKRKRVESNSKSWYIQFDQDFNELNKWHTLKDMYNYMVNNKIEANISYGGFKNKKKQIIVFGEQLYKGFYWRKINKLQYANTEVTINVTNL
jgi:hypothetical protein